MSFSQLNIDAFRSINDLGGHYSALNPVAVFLAEYMLYILVLAMIGYWFTRTHKNRMMMIHSVIAVVIAEVLGKVVGHLYSHNNPFAVLPHVHKLIDHAVDNSFPSDHSIIFFAICFSIWLVRKKTGWIWLLIALCVAISRVWVGVHYPVDVTMGAIIGIVSAIFVHWFVPKLAFVSQLLNIYEKVEQRILPTKQKSEDF